MNRAVRVLLFLVMSFQISQSRLCAAGPDSAGTLGRIDSCIASQMSIRHIPGLALAVIRDGVPLLIKGYGLANLELNVPVTPRTLFQSASVGKQFTAALVMLLVEQGKIRLDEPISTYLPDSPPAWRKITMRHLLTHTSGITDHNGDSLAADYRHDYTEDRMLAQIRRYPLAFQPGDKWAYTNAGYVLIGVIIHRVSGQFHGDLLKRYIFGPLGMETARIVSESDVVPNRAAGYRLDKGEWKNQEWVAPTFNTTAAGSLHISILDLLKWDAALSSGNILSKSSYEQIWSPVRLSNDSLHPYGFGWMLTPVNGHRTIYHPGGWQGFNNFIGRYPDDHLSVILLTNLNPDNPNRIAQAVAGICVPALAVRDPEPVPDCEPAFKRAVEKLVSPPDSLDGLERLFTQGFRPGGLSALKSSRSLINQFGPVLSIEMVGCTRVAGSTTLRYRVRYRASSRIATVIHTEGGEISAFSSSTE